ncbi:MAG: YicC family protein [Proteobacteria bacterium]|nr:YicC family protein [Pseudomonadota bacterium]MDA1285002.1 YicC family protein [Pseudomonadota bacterium]
MTGFAALKGAGHGVSWAWEVRSVNARGLDLRLRLAEGLDDLEITVRKAFSEKLTRGNVSLGLRLQSNAANAAAGLVSDQLDKVLAALKIVEQRAETIDLHLTASSAADVLALRGVLDQSDQAETDQTALIADLKAQIPTLIAAFSSARADEGRALGQILNEQLARIKTLVAEAALAAVERQAQVAENLQVNLKRVLDNSEGADSARVAQELAMLAVKADVAEEIDRLGAHISAALDLLAAKAPIGRKFDFLMQEFNREANTLCSKSGSTELTRIGLDLKTVIDQMREQVQNVE